jgi:hypothetical protein
VVVVVVLLGATLAEGAGLTVEAWTSKRESSLLVEGAVGSEGVTGLVRVSASGAFSRDSAGLAVVAAGGMLVCAFTRERAANKAAPAQIKVLKRLAINVMWS